MKAAKYYLLTIALISGFAIADETGHGDPVNCAYACTGASKTAEPTPDVTSLWDEFLDILTLDQEADITE